MNALQYRRWLRLSRGLARHGFPTATATRRQRILDHVDDLIRTLVFNAHHFVGGGLDTLNDWDDGPYYLCDEVDRWLEDQGYRHYHRVTNAEKCNKFAEQVSACVRAGFDLAVSPSAGVLGYFTVGTLRAIFPNGLPDWVQSYFAEPISEDVGDAINVWL